MGKFQTLLKDGLDPYLEGKKNFKSQSKDWDKTAKKRLETCRDCPLFVNEKNGLFKKGGLYGVKEDERIVELENKICGDCGCISTYKLRQSISICNKWK